MQRDDHEKAIWFKGKRPALACLGATITVESCNDAGSVGQLQALRPDIVIAFGVGKLSRKVIDTCPNGMLNLHGGNPEEYRGLDSHLWAIYHQDFGGLVSTLHRVNPELDDGEIVLQKPVPLHRGMGLHGLPAHNTQACIDLTVTALDMLRRHGRFIGAPSAAPALLLPSCPPS